nr:hypothetical protein [Tanacetum cinerariifolium]
MVAFLSISDASEGFDQIVDFLNAHTIQYALVINPTIYVSYDVIRRDLHLDDADGVECMPNKEIFAKLARMGYENPHPKLTFYKPFFSAQWKFLIPTCLVCRKFNFSKDIFDSMVRNVDNSSKFLMYPCFLQVVINNKVDDLTSHNKKYTSLTLTQKVFANIRRVDPIPTPHAIPQQDQPSTPLALPPQEQPTSPYDSTMPLLTTLMETYATLFKKVAELEQDKYTQALEILKLEKRVKKLEKKKRSNSLGFKRLRRVGTSQRVESSVDTVMEAVTMDVEPQGRIDQEDVNATSKGVNATEPTIFNDEEVTMTMAQTLIKMKVKKAKLLDEQIAQKLHDEEVQKDATRDKQEKDDLERAQVLQNNMMIKRKILIGMLLLSKFKKGILTISGSIKVLKRNHSS